MPLLGGVSKFDTGPDASAPASRYCSARPPKGKRWPLVTNFHKKSTHYLWILYYIYCRKLFTFYLNGRWLTGVELATGRRLAVGWLRYIDL
jgi:hypothetical protein